MVLFALSWEQICRFWAYIHNELIWAGINNSYGPWLMWKNRLFLYCNWCGGAGLSLRAIRKGEVYQNLGRNLDFPICSKHLNFLRLERLFLPNHPLDWALWAIMQCQPFFYIFQYVQPSPKRWGIRKGRYDRPDEKNKQKNSPPIPHLLQAQQAPSSRTPRHWKLPSIITLYARFGTHSYHRCRETDFNEKLRRHWSVKCRSRAPAQKECLKGMLWTITMHSYHNCRETYFNTRINVKLWLSYWAWNVGQGHWVIKGA